MRILRTYDSKALALQTEIIGMLPSSLSTRWIQGSPFNVGSFALVCKILSVKLSMNVHNLIVLIEEVAQGGRAITGNTPGSCMYRGEILDRTTVCRRNSTCYKYYTIQVFPCTE